MTKLLFAFICLTVSVAARGESKPAALIQFGIPLLGYANCSAAVVSSKSWDNKNLMFTAAHCFGLKPGDRTSNKTGTAYYRGSAGGLTVPGAKAFDFSLVNADIKSPQDLVIANVGRPTGIQVLSLAEKLPRQGEKVTLWGYPAKGIPTVGFVSPLDNLTCKYVGPFVTAKPSRSGEGLFTVQHIVRCPKSTFISGYSGGPVLNSAGKYIGTTSAYINSKVRFENDNSTYILFSGLSEEEIRARKENNNEPYKYVPNLHNIRNYSQMYYLELKEKRGRRTKNDDYVEYAAKLVHGHYQLPFKNNLLHGESKLFRKNGVLIEVWDHGRFIRIR